MTRLQPRNRGREWTMQMDYFDFTGKTALVTGAGSRRGIVFLASNGASYITGINLDINGGLYMP